MPYLWSSPNPQGATPAQLTAGAQINPINIGPAVSAILEHQRMQQQRQEQQQAQLQQAIGSLGKYMEQGKADDAANSALYQAQYPGDNPSYAGYENRVPDYGGTEALQAKRAAFQLQDEAANRNIRDVTFQTQQHNAPLQSALLDAHIRDANAQALQRENIATSPMGMKPGDARHLSLIDKDHLEAAKEETANALGVSIKDLPAALGAANQYQPGVNALKIGDHEYSDKEGSAVQSIVDAAKSYQEKLKQYSAGQGASASPVGGGNMPRPQSAADRDALPPGTQYLAPDGSIRVR